MRKLGSLIMRMGAGVLVLLLAVTGRAGAYSYGPVEQEPIVDALAAIQAALNRQPPDWAGAEAAFAAVAAEVAKDAGGQPAVAAWQAAVSRQDAALAVQVFRGIVCENLLRRLTYARAALDNYQTAKALLNKATVTYEALSPLVAAEDPQLDIDLKRRLDDAFFALGNPGVLGVGVQPPDPEGYDAAMAALRAGLDARFRVDFAALPDAGGDSATSGSVAPGSPAAEPAPTEPVPTDPVPTEPTSVEPTSVEPTSTEPVSTDPASAAPSSTTPVPAAPEPSAPAAGSPASGSPAAPAAESQPAAPSGDPDPTVAPAAGNLAGQADPTPARPGRSYTGWYLGIGLIVVLLLFAAMRNLGRRGA